MSGDAKRRALRLVETGLKLQMAGRLDEAIAAYGQSIEASPTAEAYTYRGWAYSMQGHIDEAIAECHRAIEVDPGFGNPYNDIGSYLMMQEKLDEAIPWLERAKEAPRYEPRHFPYLNLGRIFLVRGWLRRAREEFSMALQIHPGDEMALEALSRIDDLLQ
jgi:Tfp pilus assembly protein PilF